MFRKLRTRFIVISMFSVAIILGIILLITNVATYKKAINNVDIIIEMLAQNDGNFNGNFIKPPKGPMSEETPFETRFFVVEYSNDGKIYVFIDNIAAVKKNEALEMASFIKGLSKNEGFVDIYRYQRFVKENEEMIIFVDCDRQLQIVNNFFKSSILVASLGLVGVFLLVLILSKPAVMPMVKSYEKQKQFITDVSHELKTPLAIISANNELNEIEYGNSEYTDAINKQIGRLNSLVKDMIFLSKIEEDNRKTIMQEFSLSEILLSICKNYESIFEKNDKIFMYSIQDDINYVGEESLIKRLIYIVLENAYKYSIKNINFKVEKKTNIEIIISNDTEGIDDIDVNKVFNRFYRSNYHRGKMVEGSGIGLAVAKEIVSLHHGHIKANKNLKNIFEIKIIL